ncbi:hypothetical protein BC829DRAFT_421103 [Chytridium lagenaria]|nr:hypothetical protein BC829DRAFT_421103 [Chytridium lagenaria]
MPSPFLVPSVALWAVPFYGLNWWLTATVIALRFKLKVPIGDGTAELLRAELSGDKSEDELKVMKGRYKSLVYAIRAHANYIENCPYVVSTFVIAELNGMPALAIHTCLGLLFIARILHGKLFRTTKSWDLGLEGHLVYSQRCLPPLFLSRGRLIPGFNIF